MMAVAERRRSEGAQRLAEALREHPVIASVRDEQRLDEALRSRCRTVFLLSTSLGRLAEVGEAVAGAGKLLFIHLDFVGGLGRDEEAVEYLARVARPVGLITTRTNLIQTARRLGLTPLQRLFLLDSQSLATGIEAARSSRAEVVEVLPGIIPRAVQAIRSQLPGALIIAGGLVRTPREVGRALQAGASGVSTSSADLWNMEPAAFAVALEQGS
ncbi:glycerol-3-phosphate responsive antiterminator [Symbiobacterium thermophilum]|uniref:glycerol-3-phosphate responsive antiterminator n=1 Tax=Symbiobacterium thermophilum TaxID=2734 RepID=UPI000319B39A|nr:glycerol-3-phosphate responsive antiterminator [Symbiobacterium thermophilum]